MSILSVFDIDDTLFETKAKILLKTKSGYTMSMTPLEFNSYKLKNDEEFDFSQFIDAKLFHSTSTPIPDVWEKALNSIEKLKDNNGSKVVIVTARSDFDDKDLFLSTFEKYGMNTNKIHVYRAGNLQSGSAADKKKIIIKKLLEDQNYSEVQLFDDHKENLNAFLSLSYEFRNIKFIAYHVSNGKIIDPIIVDSQISWYY